MVKCKLKVFLLLWYILRISAEKVLQESNDAGQISQDDRTHNSTNLISKISSWLFPAAQSRSDQNDLEAAETGYAPQKYHATSLSNVDCNICNQSPWIPIIDNKRQNAIYHYGPPKEFSSHSIEHHSFDDHPNYYSPPIKNNINYRPNNKFSSFNLQNSISTGEIHITDYMVPPPVHFKIPPKNIYGPPQKQSFRPPNKHFYNSPSISSYSPPKPFYGPPKPVYNIPGTIYGPPKPVNGPPNFLYGPPKPVNIPPKPLYGPPRPNFELHHKPVFRPPPIHYGTPQSTYGIPPKPAYGSPEPFNIPPPPPLSSDYNSLAEYAPPLQATKYHSGEPPVEFYKTPSHSLTQTYEEPAIPGPFKTDAHLEFDLPSHNYDGSPINNPSVVTDISNTVNVPSDSYGAPVTNENIELADTIPASSGESAEQYNHQIPLPNLSSQPALPIRNHRNFNKDHSSKSLHFEEKHRFNTDVQIQPSVEVANYVASIEHPINVIQSPIYDVSVKEQLAKGQSTSPQKFLNGDYNQIFNDQNKPAQKDQEKTSATYNTFDPPRNSYSKNIQDEIAKEESYSGNNYQTLISLKDNPIIVEDNNPAASDITNTSAIPYSNQIKRDNDKETALTTSVAYNLSNQNIDDPLFKQLLSEVDKNIHNKLKENRVFTPAPLDYSAWQPTSVKSTIPTSMVPPPMFGVSTWVTPKKIQKPLQIIVPYTNNKKHIYSDKDWSLKTPKWQPPKESYTTLGSVYTPPNPAEESLWSKFMEDLRYTQLQRLPATAFTTPPHNNNYDSASTPRYNEVSLQMSIDNWTQQSYATQDNRNNYSPVSKIIPNIFLPTKPYTATTETPVKNQVNNLVAAASIRTDSVVDTRGNHVELNSVSHTGKQSKEDNPVTVPSKTVTKLIKQVAEKPLWSTSQVTESPQTKEKVYVVTPQSYAFVTPTTVIAWSMAPKVEKGKVNNGTYDSHRFTIKIESENKLTKTAKNDKTGAIKVVYSEWPHLINSLESTTSKPTARHPLFGLMDIADFTLAPKTTESVSDDQKVTTEGTPTTTPFKRSTEMNVTTTEATEA